MCLQVAGDHVEDAAEIGANQLERGDSGNSDQCGDQAVLDSGGAVFVPNELAEGAEHLGVLAGGRIGRRDNVAAVLT
jgi:hypothetical protein